MERKIQCNGCEHQRVCKYKELLESLEGTIEEKKIENMFSIKCSFYLMIGGCYSIDR